MSLLSTPIFKINKIVGKNTIETIYVFIGDNLDIQNEDPNELFIREPNNPAFLNIFLEDELTNIRANNTEILFITQSIHIDDTIGTIKLKIFEALGRTVSMDELYLFCLKSEQINPITMYQNLTQNDRIPLTKVRLNQMLTNLYDINTRMPIDFELPDLDEKYTFDDILRLNLLEREYLLASCLGQKLVFSNEYPFIVDPFYVTSYDTLLERSRKELSSLNNNLLLESGLIFKNNIYLCLARDVFNEQEKQQSATTSEYTSKIYFPFLHKANIDTVAELDMVKDKLIQDTNFKLSANMERTFSNINMFYDVYKYLNQEQQIFSQKQNRTGINFIKVVMYPDFKIKIPVEDIFKLIHATYDFPLIKFNPETRQENMYRLYTDNLTNDGRKIPFLNKATIFKLMRQIGKQKSVAVYTKVSSQSVLYYMVCEFEENGNISIYSFMNFDTPVLIGTTSDTRFANIDNIIDLTVNPLIEQIRPFFEQSGLELPSFKSINSSNIEIRELTYQTIYSITKRIDLNNYAGCLSSIFTIESSNLTENINNKDGAIMRFKRVSNFTTLDSQVAFIIEKISQGLRQQEIIDELIHKYEDMNEESANDVFAKTIKDLELVRGANKRRAIMVKINPGFKTNMLLNPITSEIKIIVSGINNIFYLDTIPIYIDSFIRITQDITSTRVENSKITNLCSGMAIEDVNFDEIVAQSEENIRENEVPSIEDETVRYLSESSGESPDNDDLLDKISKTGVASLTKQELKLLHKYSK